MKITILLSFIFFGFFEIYIRKYFKTEIEPFSASYMALTARELLNQWPYRSQNFNDEEFFRNMHECNHYLLTAPKDGANFESKYININDSERVSLKSSNPPSEHWLFLGGSTTFCLEVEDESTVSSCIQHSLNLDEDNLIQCHNLAWPGLKVTKIEDFLDRGLMSNPDTKKVIVLFGVNDAGWSSGSAPKNKFQSIITRILLPLSSSIRLADYLNRRIQIGQVRRYSRIYALSTIRKLHEIQLSLNERSIESYFLLQPNLICKANVSAVEFRILRSIDPVRAAGLYVAYETYMKEGGGIVSCITESFDKTSETIYFDWCHVGIKGNQLLSESILSVIKMNSSNGLLNEFSLALMKSRSADLMKLHNIGKNRDEVPYNYPLY